MSRPQTKTLPPQKKVASFEHVDSDLSSQSLSGSPHAESSRPSTHVGLVGSGASTIYLLYQFLKDIKTHGKVDDLSISIFEKGPELGVSMPYNPAMVDKVHVVNILPEETPELLCSFTDWLKSRNDEELAEIGISNRSSISDKGIYPRIAMNAYLRAQYQGIVKELMAAGVSVNQHSHCAIVDAVDNPGKNTVNIVSEEGAVFEVNRMVIATGHTWPALDKPDRHYYSSPWPIHKFLPEANEKYNYRIGLLGASLSAFDVLTALADRHGSFVRSTSDNTLTYIPDSDTEKFHLVLHTSQGKLPHLRCDFQWPHVMQHRFFTKEAVEAIATEEGGKLRIETYFQQFCKVPLVEALRRDKLFELAERLNQPESTFLDFIAMMNKARRYENPFLGMQIELEEARRSIATETPIHWKETLDDLMYTLNYHSPSLYAEDIRFYQQEVIPFLLNVTAFLPLESAEKLLALHGAGKVSVATGKVSVLETQQTDAISISRRDPQQGEVTEHYKMFVDCSGQKTVSIQEFPFRTLVAQGVVREATATFTSEAAARKHQARFPREVRETAKGFEYLPGGLEIDNTFHVISRDGKPNPRVYDVAYAQLKGQRPFFPGLQQCHDTGEIVAKEIMRELRFVAKKAADDSSLESSGGPLTSAHVGAGMWRCAVEKRDEASAVQGLRVSVY